MDTGLRVERTHYVDAGTRDAEGFYDYYYEYDIYRFTEGAMSLTARSYVDTPEQASFLNAQDGANEPPRRLGDADLGSALFHAACAYLRAEGRTDLQWLSGRGNGYEAVPGYLTTQRN